MPAHAASSASSPNAQTTAHSAPAAPGGELLRLAEFTLTGKRRPRQLALEHENPFCRLAASTAEGAAVCDRGCGIDPSSACAAHTCPFGMLMKPLAQVEGSTTRWIGRRFASVEAMHDALDLLGAAGIDEESILEHLPPNPVVTEAELDRVIAERRRAEGYPAELPAEEANPLEGCVVTREAIAREEVARQPETPTVQEPTPRGASSAVAASESINLGNVYEYLAQVNSLIVTARRPSIACDRFLRVLSGMVPFEEMVIYLHDPATGELVLNSTIDHAPAENGQPRAHATRLRADGLGETAFKQGRMMIERNGVIEPLAGETATAGVLAMPLPMRSERTLGVLIATLSEAGERSAIFGHEPIRLLSLLAQMLSAQLVRLEEMNPLGEAQGGGEAAGKSVQVEPAAPAEPTPPLRTAEGFLAALRAETARMARGAATPACLHVRLAGARAAEALKKGSLAPELAAALRPFDAVCEAGAGGTAWDVMLAQSGPDEARLVAARLTMVLEDALDSRGGMEEMGLRVAIGGSLPGVDSAQAEQALAQAREAGAAAEAIGDAAGVLFFGEMDADELRHAVGG